MAEAYRRQRIRQALVRAGHLVLGQPAGPFAGGGRSDLIVCVRPFGIFGAIEVKEKGEKPTRAQRAFGAQVEKSGGFWIVGYEPEEVLRDLGRAVGTILGRRSQSIAAPGESKSTMSIDIDDLFTNPPPPLDAAQLAELVDETEPVTDVPVAVDVSVTEVVINGTVVSPDLPEAAAKVMGYASAEAREQSDPSPARKRSSRRPKATQPEPEPTRDEKIAELDSRDAALDGESTPFDELKVMKDDYERAINELAAATSQLNSAVQSLLKVEFRAV